MGENPQFILSVYSKNTFLVTFQIHQPFFLLFLVTFLKCSDYYFVDDIFIKQTLNMRLDKAEIVILDHFFDNAFFSSEICKKTLLILYFAINLRKKQVDINS
jgi:hypothetical protein